MAIKGIIMIIQLAVCHGNAMWLSGEAQKLQQISSDEYKFLKRFLFISKVAEEQYKLF